MKKLWTSELAMLTIGTTLLGGTAGIFMLAPATVFGLLMWGGKAGEAFVLAAVGGGLVAWCRALVLQGRRHRASPM